MIVTDKLKSYEAAKKQVMKRVEHGQHKGLNNRAENLHQPTRVRERRMRRSKSPRQAPRCLSAFEPIPGHFHSKEHELSRNDIENSCTNALRMGEKSLTRKSLRNIEQR
ncbi:IS6 family transposase [Cyanobacteria bacterium FACHB-63]|nr:IS6 family transposase [Cyanobacteria bacterium FACHB-63]